MTNSELKSKVMTIGNRLSSRMDRRDAFIQAWQIVKSGVVSFPVRGVTAGSRQEALRRLTQYEPAQVRAFLMPEPENSVDKNAVAVMVGVNGGRGLYRLGYVPRNMAPVVAALRVQLPRLRLVEGEHNQGARLALAV
jgi:hypothetical protein